MAQIILDFGSGNTCKNDLRIAEKMIDELTIIDTRKHEVIIKWQLFEKAGDNMPLDEVFFNFIYHYARKFKYRTTASVFDLKSLKFLLQYDIPFVKIANNRSLDWLIGEVPRKIPVYVSYGYKDDKYDPDDTMRLSSFYQMCCISKYPATLFDYEKEFDKFEYYTAVSDHTIGLELFKKYKPCIWEKHYKLLDSTGLDAGSFAITPQELAEIL